LHGQTKNPEPAILLSWRTQLLQLPMLPLFVFDGKGRPKLKRGKAAISTMVLETHSAFHVSTNQNKLN
jgi:hypothetical protein